MLDEIISMQNTTEDKSGLNFKKGEFSKNNSG